MRRRNSEDTILDGNISARVKKDTYEVLRKEAKADGKTLSTLVREIAENYTEQRLAEEKGKEDEGRDK